MPLVQACFESNVVLLTELCGQREDVNATVGFIVLQVECRNTLCNLYMHMYICMECVSVMLLQEC